MKQYLLVGAGGTASYLMPVLHRYLVSLHGDDFILAVVDGDAVEDGNLARQAHDIGSVGLNKAEALCAGLPHTIPVTAYLGPDNIDSLIQDDTTVIITVDNFPCRARIEDRANNLDNVIVINAGNEEFTGSVQLWVREGKQNVTPPIGFLHPEIRRDGPDRAAMTCAAVAALPGGGQTAIANQTAATFIMHALNHLHYAPSLELRWHEIQFDAQSGEVETIDYRDTKAWTLFNSPPSSAASSSSADAPSSSATTPPRSRRNATTDASTSPTSG